MNILLWALHHMVSNRNIFFPVTFYVLEVDTLCKKRALSELNMAPVLQSLFPTVYSLSVQWQIALRYINCKALCYTTALFFHNRDCKILRSFNVLLLSKLFSKLVICLWKTITRWNAKSKQKDQQHTCAMFRHCLWFLTSRKARHREVTVRPNPQKPSETELGIETHHRSQSNKLILDWMKPAPVGLSAHRHIRQMSANIR